MVQHLPHQQLSYSGGKLLAEKILVENSLYTQFGKKTHSGSSPQEKKVFSILKH